MEIEDIEHLEDDHEDIILEALSDLDYSGRYCNEYYGIDMNVRHMLKHERAVAYFLTRAEAEKYCIYQSHNLNEPRVFTTYTGYDNRGDLTCIKKMLLRVGNKLVSQ